MSKLLRIGMFVTGLLAAAAALAACGGGLSTEDATAICDDQLAREDACKSASVRASCISCYESCGNDCQRLEKCPLAYACPGDDPGTGGGTP